MQKVAAGVWVIFNIGMAYFLCLLVALACSVYYFEDRTPPDAGYAGQVQLTMGKVIGDIFKASICSATLASLAACTAFYAYKMVWATSVEGKLNTWGRYLSIVIWIIIFFGSAIQSYQFFVQRSSYF